MLGGFKFFRLVSCHISKRFDITRRVQKVGYVW